ncbi:hypothetical protein [Streptomyces aureus]|uniref:hypothetical protein n=1 Tax=Streptomyces aureus TaxID=193461 RepID=UPI003689DADF
MSTPKPRKELDTLLTRTRHTPSELRRIAELTEIVDSDEAALYWWHEAAVAGDQDAIDYLEMLDQEQQPQPANAPPMPAAHTSRTIIERYGRKRVTIVLVCAFVMLGLIGWVKSGSFDDGPPACAMEYRDVYGAGPALRNKMVECADAIDEWCATNYPENPDGCSNAVLVDGDARNVGKD